MTGAVDGVTDAADGVNVTGAVDGAWACAKFVGAV